MERPVRPDPITTGISAFARTVFVIPGPPRYAEIQRNSSVASAHGMSNLWRWSNDPAEGGRAGGERQRGGRTTSMSS